MKSYYTILIILTLLLSNTQYIYPQWVQTNGPGNGLTTCLAASGDYVIANAIDGGIFYPTDGGILISSNKGTNWKQIQMGFPNKNVHSLIFSGTNIFAGTIYGVFFSSDLGNSWTQVNNGLIDTNIIALIASGNTIFAGTPSGVFSSTNNGLNWIQVNNGLTNTNIHCFAAIDSNIYVGTDSGGVFSSTDSGMNWIKISSTLPSNKTITALTVNENNIFAISGYIFRSTDNGNTWSAFQTSGKYLALSDNILILGIESKLYDGGLYRSTNYGANWIKVLDNGGVQSMAVSGNNIYTAVCNSDIEWEINNGLFLSKDNGLSWTKVGLPLSQVNGLIIKGNNIFASTNVVHLSTNNGTTWTQVANFGVPATYSFAISKNNLLVGIADWKGLHGVFLTSDDGSSWIRLNYGMELTSVYSIGVNGDYLFAGTDQGIYRSIDNGANWVPINNGLTNPYIHSLAVSGNNIIAGSTGGAFLSTNNGTDWVPVNNGLTNTYILSVAFIGNNIFAGTRGGAFLSTNMGAKWQQINNGLPDSTVNVIAAKGNNIFVGTNAGLYYSTNNGTNWISTGLSNIGVLSLACNDTIIYAGTNAAGVWYRSLSEILPVELTSFTASSSNNIIKLNWTTATELNNTGFDIERSLNKSDWMKISFIKGNGNSTSTINYSYEDRSVSGAGKYYYRLKQIDNNGMFKYSNIVEAKLNAPISFALNQNYPNPFNPTTTIAYTLKEKGFVKLKVFDIRGELVKVLVNESKDAGYYETEFNARGLASGVYIYRIEVIGQGNKSVYSDVKKTLLLK